jgi:dUTP pyrophosphatase
MHLNIKTKNVEFYKEHKSAYEGDSGIDLFFPNEITIKPKETVLIDLEIVCQMKKSNISISKDVGFLLYPRSSIYKTPLRMANSVGVIDSKYRGSIKVAVDNIGEHDYVVKRGDRLFQICSADLQEITVKLVDDIAETTRGNGFGSSGTSNSI